MLRTQAGGVQGGRPLLGRRRYGRDGGKEGEKEERLMPGSRLVGGALFPRGRPEEEQLTGTPGWGLEAEAPLPILCSSSCSILTLGLQGQGMLVARVWLGGPQECGTGESEV